MWKVVTVDETSDRIEQHIAHLLRTAPFDEKDPTAAPPAWFDVNNIRDEELRDEWTATDLDEIDGILNRQQCAHEELLENVPEVVTAHLPDMATGGYGRLQNMPEPAA